MQKSLFKIKRKTTYHNEFWVIAEDEIEANRKVDENFVLSQVCNIENEDEVLNYNVEISSTKEEFKTEELELIPVDSDFINNLYCYDILLHKGKYNTSLRFTIVDTDENQEWTYVMEMEDEEKIAKYDEIGESEGYMKKRFELFKEEIESR